MKPPGPQQHAQPAQEVEQKPQDTSKDWDNLLKVARLVSFWGTLFAAFYFVVPWITDSDPVRAFFLGAWTIGVPLYFAIEWTYLAPQHNPDAPDMKRYKEGSDRFRQLWLAVASILTLIYFGDHLKDPTRAEVEGLKRQVSNLEEWKKGVDDKLTLGKNKH